MGILLDKVYKAIEWISRLTVEATWDFVWITYQALRDHAAKFVHLVALAASVFL